ncbi:hypothetical protein AB6A40_007206 [Gnathostoma spinigerum]|uniref:39S ribosomal protein L30, mitochondrial n=1 Tax=Gnathostoma spinigerum TaxID=75299 RepID=A0ABD6EV97_9BILA
MAKVIRNQWVYKPLGRWHRYLPRRHDGIKEYDFEANEAGPEHFPEKMEGERPKLWLAWIYRKPVGEPHWTKKRLADLFGEDYEPGRMEIFKNTPSQNAELWHVKHLIELRPLTFPNGEPTLDDVTALEVFPDGRCVIDKKLNAEPADLQIADTKKQFSRRYLTSHLCRRYARFKDVFEDTVYSPENISIVD